MSMIGFPLLLIPLAIVNIIVFLMPGVSFTDPIITVTLVSKAAWKVTFGDMLLTLGMLLLLVEVIKAMRPRGKYFTDHFLALIVFAGAAAEFLMLPQFATSVFFLLTVLTLVDFLAGISLRTKREARRDRSAKTKPVSVPEAAPDIDAGATVPAMATIEPAHPAPVEATAATENAVPGSR